MNDTGTITDEDLTAYLDGEADAALRARIDAALEDDLALSDRLSALDAPVDLLPDALAPLLNAAPPLAVEEPARNWVGLAAALVLGVGIGGAAMLALGRDDVPTDGWQDYAAAYHLLYRNETLAGVGPGDSLGHVSDRINRDLSGATGLPGLDFRRAQVLGFGDEPLIQLAYLADDGTPVALCITVASGATVPMASLERHGLETVGWSDGQHEFLLIGGADTPGLADLAATIRDRL